MCTFTTREQASVLSSVVVRGDYPHFRTVGWSENLEGQVVPFEEEYFASIPAKIG